MLGRKAAGYAVMVKRRRSWRWYAVNLAVEPVPVRSTMGWGVILSDSGPEEDGSGGLGDAAAS